MNKIPEGNRLINSSSPYLLQHAFNPVDWYPWGDEALDAAKTYDKPIIVSIGYSACHWCHVMEEQSFENHEIANLMNDNFICIKVDREERPDIDQIYMAALQVMGISGGWPLNVLLTPDQKPFYGGTYFPPQGWMELLQNVSEVFRDKRVQLEESASKFSEHLRANEFEKFNVNKQESNLKEEDFIVTVHQLKSNFDNQWGGFRKAPKFPMPSIWSYLLDVHHYFGDKESLEMVSLTLNKIAWGGIYDHIGGGFARYATDIEWHIPHFEKMLYDNAQLLSLYAKGHSIIPDANFEKLILQTINWLENEMLSPDGGYFSALDADSDGEEGKYYNWSYEEFICLAGTDAQLLTDYYNITEAGNWEEGKNTPRILSDSSDFAKKYNKDVSELNSLISRFERKALQFRKKRTMPGLDDKILTAWNGQTIRGLVDCFKTLKDQNIANKALRTGDFILKHSIVENRLYRNFKNGRATIPGFLEDYAWTIDGFTGLYEISFDIKWLKAARQLTEYVIENFYDEADSFFFFSDNQSDTLIARKKEFSDNVIPSSNAGMAKNLFMLSHYFQDENYPEIAHNMMDKMSAPVKSDPEYLSYWASIILLRAHPITEVVIAGNHDWQTIDRLVHLNNHNVIMMSSTAASQDILPLTNGKNSINDSVTFYVCKNKTCQLPVTDINSAIDQIKNSNT